MAAATGDGSNDGSGVVAQQGETASDTPPYDWRIASAPDSRISASHPGALAGLGEDRGAEPGDRVQNNGRFGIRRRSP